MNYGQSTAETEGHKESFFANFKVMADPGYLRAMQFSFFKNKFENSGTQTESDKTLSGTDDNSDDSSGAQDNESECDTSFMDVISKIKKGQKLSLKDMVIKDAETSPPKRYNSGSMILTMENAGQFIEDDDLRSQIKGSGIGTSATRAEILKKLFKNGYLLLNKKTQIITPTKYGEMIYEIVGTSIRSLLDPKLTASWEKCLTMVAEGDIKPSEYSQKMDDFVVKHTNGVKQSRITQNMLY